MLIFGQPEVAKEEILICQKKKKTIKILDFNLDNIVVSKLIETKTNSKYLIGYLDEIIRSLVLILSKMSGYEWICLSI